MLVLEPWTLFDYTALLNKHSKIIVVLPPIGPKLSRIGPDLAEIGQIRWSILCNFGQTLADVGFRAECW